MKNKINNKILFISAIILNFLPLKVFALDFNLDNLFEGVADAAGNTARSIFVNIDVAIYKLFEKIMALFFDIANAKFLTGDVYIAIFKRVFLIIGVFMLFKLILSFITYLISPDSISDPKNDKNLGKLIGRVIVSLLFLIVLLPTGNGTKFEIDDSNSYNRNINEQGILFGTLQSVQDAIIDNNVLGKIILGNSAFPDKGSTNSTAMVQKSSNYTALAVFNAFFRIDTSVLDVDPDTGAAICTNKNTTIADSIEDAKNIKINDWDTAKELVLVTCNQNSKSYLIDYYLFVSTIIGIVITVIMFMFTFDVAIRAIKLGILKLLSPIPAISYIDPKSAKDGMFANYIKTLFSTYLDIFLRIALMYIVILLISALTGSDTDLVSGVTDPFAQVIVIIALLLFLVQGPKFIMQALGIKSKGTGLGFGAALLGGAFAGGLAGAATGGISGAVKGFLGGANAGTQNQWAAQNGQRPNMSARQAALNRGAQLGSGDPNAKGMGIGAMIGGGISNVLAGTNQSNIDKMKGKFFNEQRDLDDRGRIASSLGFGHNITDQDWNFLTSQKYANGNDIARKNGSTYEFLDSSGKVIGTSASYDGSVDIANMASALAFDNAEMKKGLGKKQDELDKAKKQNAQHDPKAMRPKFTASKRYK